MKKILFIPFCLSLFCSSAYSQQVTNLTALKKITPETIQAVAQEIEKLTPEEKLVLKDHVIQTLEKQGVSNNDVIPYVIGGVVFVGAVAYYLFVGTVITILGCSFVCYNKNDMCDIDLLNEPETNHTDG